MRGLSRGSSWPNYLKKGGGFIKGRVPCVRLLKGGNLLAGE